MKDVIELAIGLESIMANGIVICNDTDIDIVVLLAWTLVLGGYDTLDLFVFLHGGYF